MHEKLAEIRFISQPDQLKHVRDKVRAIVKPQGCQQEDIESMVLAINEACMNVIQHAYGPGARGDIVLEILRNKDQLIFRLIDFAKSVDECTIKSRPLDEVRPGGLGVHFIHEVMDSVVFLECPGKVGNILEMKKHIKITSRE
jgi:phosphoserine phosphatase RsbU/P